MEYVVVSMPNQCQNKLSSHYFCKLFEKCKWANGSMVKQSARHAIIMTSSKEKLDCHQHLMSYEVLAFTPLRNGSINSIRDTLQPFVEKVNIILCISASTLVVQQCKMGSFPNKFRHTFYCTQKLEIIYPDRSI